MRYVNFTAAALALASLSGAAAAECPAVPDRSDQVNAILAQTRAAPDAVAARIISNRLWEIWADAPDATAQALLDQGMERRAAYDFEAATAAFDDLIAYCPHYAEGYNQRAFVRFIVQDYGRALEDLELALERNPDHVAAMTGLALTLMQLGRTQAGQSILRDALALNPWLPERAFLIEEPGEEL